MRLRTTALVTHACTALEHPHGPSLLLIADAGSVLMTSDASQSVTTQHPGCRVRMPGQAPTWSRQTSVHRQKTLTVRKPA